MRAAIYCRLSKEDEDHSKESESIQNQKAMLVQYAAAHDLAVYRIYCDEDYSGIDRDRPDFNRMLQAAAEHRFDVVLAKTQSRFTRDMELVEKYLHGKFAEWGVRFIAVVDHVDTGDAANKKSRQINGLVNEWYLEDLSNNVRSVLDHKRAAGRYIASFALYGYAKDPADKNHLVIDPEPAAVVRRIFALCLSGSGTARIAAILNKEGVPSPAEYKRQRGTGPRAGTDAGLWSRATLYRMLTNQTYEGNLEQGRHKKISYKSKKTVWLPKSEWVVVQGTHAAIIDAATFAAVQRMLGNHARGGGGGKIHPLAGKLYCGCCGSGMEQTGSGTARYMRCRMHQRCPARCPGQPYLPLAALEAAVLARVQAYAARWFAAPGAAAPETTAPGEGQTARAAALQRLQQEAGRRRRALQSLYLDKCDGVLSEAAFSTLQAAYSRELAALTAQIERCAEVRPASPEPAAYQAALRQAAQPAALTRELACLLIDRIVVYPPGEGDAVRQIDLFWLF